VTSLSLAQAHSTEILTILAQKYNKQGSLCLLVFKFPACCTPIVLESVISKSGSGKSPYFDCVLLCTLSGFGIESCHLKWGCVLNPAGTSTKLVWSLRYRMNYR